VQAPAFHPTKGQWRSDSNTSTEGAAPLEAGVVREGRPDEGSVTRRASTQGQIEHAHYEQTVR